MISTSSTSSTRDTVPLPLAVHLAMYTVIGLFCMFAGPLNLIDPSKIIPNAVAFLAVGGFCWGYVFGIFMGRREAVILGWAASGLCVGVAGWLLMRDTWLAALFAFIGLYGVVVMARYRRWVVTA